MNDYLPQYAVKSKMPSISELVEKGSEEKTRAFWAGTFPWLNPAGGGCDKNVGL